MPFAELLELSLRDPQQDIDGNLSVSRHFSVWGVEPSTIYLNPSSVTDGGTPPQKLPAYGHVLTTTTGTLGENGVPVQLRLHRYTVSPEGGSVFHVRAEYSNDLSLVPLGTRYVSQSQYSLVAVPYVRWIPTILTGANPNGPPVAPLEDSENYAMPCKRISQTVTIRRKQRKNAESISAAVAGRLMDLATHGWCKYEGMDVRSRGTQYLDVTYNWYQELGIKFQTQGTSIDTGNASSPTRSVLVAQAEAYPPGAKPAYHELGEEVWFVPPYHSVRLRMIFSPPAVPNPDNPTSGLVAAWIYRCTLGFNNTGKSLLGSEKFEWNVVR